ncbi:hypothetical protein M8542_15620 [Amycolatopsis sp. OK19-0408]|uniref:Uncharacterized protein n=1 Tax=Amycolatopsis iheyensis TaxID=2945988 RepID=A0A9X2NBN5_9PSEU|nr:hypothetical protein [Amycolatopsis iheyensis]MCR6484251.1 hypothetical protein [Amycolatopsis iheyensis]
MKKQVVGGAVVGAAVLAIVVAQFWPGEDAPPAAPPPLVAPTTTTVPTRGQLEVYRLAEGPAIEIPVPATWAVSRDKERASYRRGDLLLETDRVPITQEDAVGGLRAVAAGQGGTVAEHAPIGDRDAAEWDYTYERGGVPRRVSVVGVGAGDALVTVRFEAPATEFERNRGVLDAALMIRS